jgi:alkanesulfonate monooxygenase
VRELVEYAGLGGPAPKIIGSPTQVADQLEEWVDETDVDGFNLSYILTPESFSDFVELVVPELQRRGVYKLDYSAGTLREKLYGAGRSRLPQSHPAATYRYGGSSNSIGPQLQAAGSARAL